MYCWLVAFWCVDVNRLWRQLVHHMLDHPQSLMCEFSSLDLFCTVQHVNMHVILSISSLARLWLVTASTCYCQSCVCLSVYLSVCLSVWCLSVCLSVWCLSVWCLSVCLMCVSVYLSVWCLSVWCLSVCLSDVCLSGCLSVQFQCNLECSFVVWPSCTECKIFLLVSLFM